jgi:hypothetical protein
MPIEADYSSDIKYINFYWRSFHNPLLLISVGWKNFECLLTLSSECFTPSITVSFST